MKQSLLTILCWLALFFTNGQDIHFSQFDKAPTNLNPALTGNFEGQWRFSANQRSQWRSVSRSFNTFGFGAENNEQKLVKNLYHGVNYMNDVAGDGDYRTHEFNITNAYKMALGDDGRKVLTAGLQLGINHKAIDFNAFQYDAQFNGYKYDANLPSNEVFLNERYTNLNLGLGLLFSQLVNNELTYEVGVGSFNLLPQKQGFFGAPAIIRDRRLTVHGSAIYQLEKEWHLMPGFLFQTQGVYRELVIGSNIRYVQRDRKSEYVAPYAGLWFRTKDAVNIVAGLYYNNWVAGVSYDINVSELTPASNVRGGLEFSFQYILNIFKPELKQYRLCPDYL
jgi:type IX secretion system PorP/SprF family membrane protein